MDLKNNETLTNTELFYRDDQDPAFGELAASIARHNFEWRFVTLVMFNTIQAIGLQTFLAHYQGSVVLKLGRFVARHRYAVHQFVIFGKDSTEITDTIRWLVQSIYDTNALFIIVCCSVNDMRCDNHKIFPTLAENYITNVIVLRTSHRTAASTAYSYELVANGECNNSVPYEVDIKQNCVNDSCFQRLFPKKLKNFHLCNLRLSTLEQPPFMYLYNGTKQPSGADGELMRLAANMLNATLVLNTPVDNGDWGHYAKNNWTGSLGDIYNGRVHASVCSAPLTANKYGNFQISFEYYSMDIVWAAKLPSKRATWEKLLYPFNIHLRIALMFMFIIIIMVNTLRNTKVCRRVRKVFRLDPPKHSLLFYSWTLFLGMPMVRAPMRRSALVIVYTWIWFCFIIRSAYQAALINALKFPAYTGSLNTFQDVLKEGYPYGGLTSLKEYFTDDKDIYNGWVRVDLNHLDETLDAILDETTDFVLAANKAVIQHHLGKYNGTKQLQIIPKKIVNSPTVVYFKMYSPITYPLSYVLRIAFEAGFVQRLYDTYLHQDYIRQRPRHQRPKMLEMDNFAGAFLLLILGWVIAVVYFIVEIVFGNLDDESQ